jgi:hypothetical protein
MKRVLVVLVIGAAAFGVVSAVQASIPDSNGVVHACYSNNNLKGYPPGTLRARDTAKINGQVCFANESPVDLASTAYVDNHVTTTSGGWSGSIGTIPANSPLVFAGPVTTVTTTADQSITATGSMALGTTAGTGSAAVGVCASPAGANTPTYLDPNPGLAFEGINVTPNRLTYAVSEVGSRGAGAWDVGMCVVNGAVAIDNTDWSIGYASVTNGLPTSFAPTKKQAHKQ